MKEYRPSPDKILKKIKEEEHKAARGKLKIYLGAAPGVGKTYTMLEDALQKREQNLDVVVGIVESHGRKEIEAFLRKFEILPKQVVIYHDKQLMEFDIDAVLKRSPALILVDEMAYANVPGLRHRKRWQDIREILDWGIDVYTTLNVQHLESLNDVVAEIIGVNIEETVPDFMLELADTIELIDIPPEEMIKRLQEGKVYFPEQIEIAKENFFRKGNLIALRELALRVTAERVGKQAFLYRQDLGIKQIWPIKEKLLVCVGPRTYSTKIIREASRIAKNLQIEWIAVYVDQIKIKPSIEKRNDAIQNLRLAQQLGAETKILTGYDLVKEIMNFAHDQNITLILVGKKIRSRWRDLLFRRLADEIVRHSDNISVYIITSQEKDSLKHIKPVQAKKKTPYRVYGISITILVIASLINFLLFPHVHASNYIMIYLLAVTVIALFGEIGPSILASLLSVLAYDFFFVQPYYSFYVNSAEYLLTLIIMLLVAHIISYLTLITKHQVKAAKFAEQHIFSLHKLSRQLARIRGVDKLLQAGIWHISDQFNSEVTLLFPNEKGKLVVKDQVGAEDEVNEKERGVIQWVYEMGQMAGGGTETLPFLKPLYIPLLGFKGAIGVLRISPNEQGRQFNSEEMNILQASAHQIAIAIEVDQLQEAKIKSGPY
jgi:two-component system sensor histidine kinase KdpD